MTPTMMNTTLNSEGPQYLRSPTDAMDRHDYGVQKNRKPASTGGGRAWSEDEEVYLLQTRLQKMPYKHIAAHLKKSELACRLHYHQLSHGSNRRKRTTSMSSGSSVQSPTMTANVPSPIMGHSTTTPPPPYLHTYSPSAPSHIQLPPATTLLYESRSPPRPIAILPKPTPAAPLRLNCATPPNPSSPSPPIDKDRLHRAYDAHRASFWLQVAASYGPGPTPLQLEDAWRRDSLSTPLTPCISPDSALATTACYACPAVDEKRGDRKEAATSIAALLGIDASPRSPKERELIRRMEEGEVIEVM